MLPFLNRMMLGGNKGPIQFVGSSQAASSSVSLPAHLAGDMIVMLAGGNSTTQTTVPVPPSGWTTALIANASFAGTSHRAIVIAYKIATSSSEVSGTWGGSTYQLGSVVFRNASGIGNTISRLPAGSGAITTGTFNSIAIANNKSWVLGTTYAPVMTSDPSGMVRVANNMGAYIGPVVSFASRTYSQSAAVDLTATIEILN